jgi:hypothetical protein
VELPQVRVPVARLQIGLEREGHRVRYVDRALAIDVRSDFTALDGDLHEPPQELRRPHSELVAELHGRGTLDQIEIKVLLVVEVLIDAPLRDAELGYDPRDRRLREGGVNVIATNSPFNESRKDYYAAIEAAFAGAPVPRP